MQPVSLVLAVPLPSLYPTTGIHLPLQPVPSVSLYRRRPGVGDNLALAPSLPAGTTKEGRGRSRPRTRLRPRPARLLACSPARLLARFLASPRFQPRKSPTTRSPALLARLASPSYYFARHANPAHRSIHASVLVKGGARSIAHGRANNAETSRARRSNGSSFILLRSF